MPTTTPPPLNRTNPVEAARAAIWLLFQEHHIDENLATTCLLAIDLGSRRAKQASQSSGNATSTRRAA